MTVEEDARKRCPEWLCDWRKVPESDDRSVLVTVEEGAGKRCSGRVTGGRCRKAMLGLCPESSTHINKQGENQCVFDRTHASNCTHPKAVGHRFGKHHLKLLCSH